MTPQKAWNGRKPSGTDLKLFRSIDYVQVDDQVKTKLDDKNKRMIFVGNDQKSKGYKLYNPDEGKMMISRVVQFDEEGAWNWKVDDGEKYDFLLVLDEKNERYEGYQKLVTPQQSPINSTSHLSSSSSWSSSSGSPPSPPRKTMSLYDLYEETNPIDDDLTLYCHFAICKPTVFEKQLRIKNIELLWMRRLHQLRRITHINSFLKKKKSIYVKWI